MEKSTEIKRLVNEVKNVRGKEKYLKVTIYRTRLASTIYADDYNLYEVDGKIIKTCLAKIKNLIIKFLPETTLVKNITKNDFNDIIEAFGKIDKENFVKERIEHIRSENLNVGDYVERNLEEIYIIKKIFNNYTVSIKSINGGRTICCDPRKFKKIEKFQIKKIEKKLGYIKLLLSEVKAIEESESYLKSKIIFKSGVYGGRDNFLLPVEYADSILKIRKKRLVKTGKIIDKKYCVYCGKIIKKEKNEDLLKWKNRIRCISNCLDTASKNGHRYCQKCGEKFDINKGVPGKERTNKRLCIPCEEKHKRIYI